MNLKNPFISTPIKFGITGAVLIITMFLVFYFSSANPLVEMGMFDFFILPIFLFLGIKEFRDTFNNKLLEFWQGMTLGFICYLVIAILTSLFILIFVTVINPEVLDTYIASRLDILEGGKANIIEKMGEASYQESFVEIQQISLTDVILDNFLKKTMVGMLLTIMISIIMKRKPKTESND